MAKEYLDKTGLAYFWSKVKAYVDSHSGGGDSLYTFTGTASGNSSLFYYNITVDDSSSYTDGELCKAKFNWGRANGQYCANHTSYYVYRVSATLIRYVVSFAGSVYPNSGDTLYAHTAMNISGTWAISH